MQYNLPHVTVSVGSDLLQLPRMLDCEETEKPGNRTVNFLQHFSYYFFTGFHSENPLY